MSSLRQIEANRRNAHRSTGPVSEEGKKISRQNALRHGLTAETVIADLEDAEDYVAFEMAVMADFDAQSAVERELVLRLASVLWRLRRATAIESGLFKIHARHWTRFRRIRRTHQQRQEVINDLYPNGVTTDATAGPVGVKAIHKRLSNAQSPEADTGPSNDVTRSYIRLANLSTCPLDRLSRYEASLWRQASQILFALGFLNGSRRRMGPRFARPRY